MKMINIKTPRKSVTIIKVYTLSFETVIYLFYVMLIKTLFDWQYAIATIYLSKKVWLSVEVDILSICLQSLDSPKS